ncbi:MAG: dUTP diphosphatase [Saprospiraceae bacterium]
MNNTATPTKPVPVGIETAGQPLPAYATSGAAGLDLRADVSEAVTIEPGGRALIPTGLRLAIPAGFEAQVRPRSGLALRHGVTVLNSPGTIDSDYRGPVGVILANFGAEPFTVEPGARIAQAVFCSVARVEWVAMPTDEETQRGAGGFGSTGKD